MTTAAFDVGQWSLINVTWKLTKRWHKDVRNVQTLAVSTFALGDIDLHDSTEWTYVQLEAADDQQKNLKISVTQI